MEWLLKCVGFIDLTTLTSVDNDANVSRLCWKARNPIRADILARLGVDTKSVHTPAVCVYPALVECASAALAGTEINVASVATGFPSGQYTLRTRLAEVREAVAQGAREIDVVVNRGQVLRGDWRSLYDEIREMKAACELLDSSHQEKQFAHLKVILAVGELGSLSTVYRAAMVSMYAGADFVKTSTGKETVNATLPLGATMLRAVRDYYLLTGVKVGFKPAGGIRTAKDAFSWCILVRELLGDAWLNSHLFRLGASGLLIDIERQLYFAAFGRHASAEEFVQ